MSREQYQPPTINTDAANKSSAAASNSTTTDADQHSSNVNKNDSNLYPEQVPPTPTRDTTITTTADNTRQLDYGVWDTANTTYTTTYYCLNCDSKVVIRRNPRDPSKDDKVSCRECRYRHILYKKRKEGM